MKNENEMSMDEKVRALVDSMPKTLLVETVFAVLTHLYMRDDGSWRDVHLPTQPAWYEETIAHIANAMPSSVIDLLFGREPEGPLKEYRVVWSRDYEATSARAAAEMARETQLDPESVATIFDVSELKAHAAAETIDLQDE